MAEQNETLIVPMFKTYTVINEALSKKHGCPKYDDMEIVEIRMAANKQTVGVFPAHEIWKTVDQPDGSREPMTYAMRWPDLYRKFKANETQDLSGTPLAEAPFLTQAKRMELKALNIHTVEALSAVDGQNLKMIGMGGRELKSQAEAYLKHAEGTALDTRLAAENASLRQQIEDLQKDFASLRKGAIPATVEVSDDEDEEEPEEGDGAPSPFEDWDDADIKLWIESEGGSKPRANASHATLVRQADKLNAELAAKNGA